jgi:regulator of protease activity HflC (stomatin/prohibitin superfamily)
MTAVTDAVAERARSAGMASSERPAWKLPGALVLVATVAAVVVGVGFLGTQQAALVVTGIVLLALAVLAVPGLTVVPPNQSRVLVFFGRYIGTVRTSGFWWVNPLVSTHKVSLKIRNFESDTLKVNDAAGNPVEIAAVITWRVVDTAKAVFDVENYEAFVRIQSETAVRHVASRYPYDAYEEGVHSLQGNTEEVAETLQTELQSRLADAGVAVIDTRLRRLAYAPEIAGEMLRRQQANAVVAARSRIVEGAVSMVDMALRHLSEDGIVQLDEPQKAALVANLMVVLVSDRGAQPVVATGG